MFSQIYLLSLKAMGRQVGEVSSQFRNWKLLTVWCQKSISQKPNVKTWCQLLCIQMCVWWWWTWWCWYCWSWWCWCCWSWWCWMRCFDGVNKFGISRGQTQTTSLHRWTGTERKYQTNTNTRKYKLHITDKKAWLILHFRTELVFVLVQRTPHSAVLDLIILQ